MSIQNVNPFMLKKLQATQSTNKAAAPNAPNKATASHGLTTTPPAGSAFNTKAAKATNPIQPTANVNKMQGTQKTKKPGLDFSA